MFQQISLKKERDSNRALYSDKYSTHTENNLCAHAGVKIVKEKRYKQAGRPKASVRHPKPVDDPVLQRQRMGGVCLL